jgi:hypothetical protein
MTSSKVTFRNLLINDVALTALVPATRIFLSWPDNFNTLPCISYQESNNFTADGDYADDNPISETSVFEVHIWTNPQVSSTAIAQAVDTIMNNNLWNRDGSVDMKEPDTGYNHKVMTYSTRLYA